MPPAAIPLRSSSRSQSHGRSAPVLPGVGSPEQTADSLEGTIVPGDVLFVRGSGGLLELGTAGGVLGHVMIVVKAPEHVSIRSGHARYLKSVWPSGVSDIWKVRCVESSRSRDGLHEAELYLYIDRKTRLLKLLGELHDGEFDISNEATELWQSPEALRSRLSNEMVAEVLNEMKELVARANWSWTTAARAVLRADEQMDGNNDKAQLYQEIQECWAKDPICTSVVIHFWQRALVKLARALSNPRNGIKKKPVDMILEWLPLKSDRTLPGVLLETMRKCGWRQLTTISAAASRAQGSGQAVKPKEAAKQPMPVAADPTPAQPAPMLPCAPVVAKYCRAHDTTQKRVKTEPRYAECTSCHVLIQTNYADFALCPPCSDKQDRCMNCGVGCAGCAFEGGFSPVRHAQPSARLEEPPSRASALRHMGSAEFAPPPAAGPPAAAAAVAAAPPPPPSAAAAVPPPPPPPVPAPGTARFCGAHGRTERRPKTEPRLRECTACRVSIQTNYLDFALCPVCSEKRDQCMLCGSSACEPRSFVPAALPLKAEVFGASPVGANSVFGFALDPLPPLPAAPSLPAQVPQKFCSMHNRTEKRPKGEPRLRECTACHVQIQTNYMDFALCPHCSEARDQCMICGAGAGEGHSYMPAPLPASPLPAPFPAPLPARAEDQATRPPPQGQVPPCFCCMHDSTQKRPKTEPRFRECTSCRMMVQTNYADMALCPPCSDRERRCMVCGAGAGTSGSCMLPPNLMSPLPMPNLFARNV